MAGQIDPLKIAYIPRDISVDDLYCDLWANGHETLVDRYWSGEIAPAGRRFKTRLLWSDTALYVRFEADQSEPLVVSEIANLDFKTPQLWECDVCEIFIAPDRSEQRRYFEFEIAPNGEWIDLKIDLTSGNRETDWDFESGMQSAAKIETGNVVMSLKVDWTALGKKPKVGDLWLGNLFRCVGEDPGRGYLAWQPTFTTEPAFHLPEKFGEFEFIS